MFLPTMPQDDLAEHLAALIAAAPEGENPVFYRRFFVCQHSLIEFKILGLYLYTLTIGHKFCNI